MRAQLFWFYDLLRGSAIKNELEDIKWILRDPFDVDQKERRELHVKKLLEHAVQTVPYYEGRTVSNLTDFPVVNKKVVQDNFESFKSSLFHGKDLFKVATSGSTGVPLMLFHNNGKRHRNTADVLYFLENTGYEIGNTLFELEVWRNHNRRNGFKNFLQNTVQFDVSSMNGERIEKLLKLLSKSSNKKNILGFSSALESICAYIETNNIPPKTKNIESVIANSEYLNTYTREAVQRIFDCPIYSRYSSEELGILAHQTSTSDVDFQINWASYYVEILDMNSDIPAKNGTLGRLVVTDLFNYSMPLIRYDTGDVAMFNESDKRFLKTPEGRKMDMIFDTQGNMLSSYVVYTKFHPYYHLLHQYQFVQMGEKEYLIKLNIKNSFAFERELISSFKDDFGKDAIITVAYVDEIPPLSSGKRKKVVNEYKKS